MSWRLWDIRCFRDALKHSLFSTYFSLIFLKLPWDKWTFGLRHLSLQVKLHFKRSEKPKPSTHFSRLNTQLNDMLIDSFAVSIYFTLYTCWDIYTVTWVNICSCLSLWLTVQVAVLDVNCWTCHEMAFAFNVPKVWTILWSDCQSVVGKSFQWFQLLVPITNPASKHILRAQTPTGLHQ